MTRLRPTLLARASHTLNIGTLSDSARNGIVDPDGKIVSFGYTSQPTGVGTQTANRIVLARLHGGGAPPTGGDGRRRRQRGGARWTRRRRRRPRPIPGTFDTDFGVGGIVNSTRSRRRTRR